jgi:hypothetical protein
MIARRIAYAGVVAGMLAVGAAASAQTAPKKPANATAQCTDGTYSTAKTEAGACSKHGGVKTWFGAPGGAAGKEDAKKDAGKKDAAGTKESGKKDGGKKESAANAGAPPAGATGQCADGSFTRAKTQSGACSNHGGVKTWFAADTKATGASPAAAASTAPAATPKGTPPPPPPPTAAAPTGAAPASAAATTKAAPAQKTAAASTGSSGKAQIVAPPAGTPDNATAKCKDGTYSFAKTHSGACSKHGGVSEWYK